MKPIVTFSTIALVLAACSSTAPITKSAAAYRPESQARVRVYGQNQKPTIITSGIDCANGQRGSKINVGGSMGDAFGSLVGASKSESLGMPQTEFSRSISVRNGILSKAFFRELAVPAGQAVNVYTAFNGLSNVLKTPTHTIIQREGSCTSDTVSFVPKAGHDYEVVGTTGRSCGVAVFEVAANGNLTEIPVSPAAICRK